MTENDEQRSPEPPDAARSIDEPLGSSGSPTVDQVERCPEEEEDIREQALLIELLEILKKKESNFSIFLDAAHHFARNQRCELPSIVLVWRRIQSLLYMALEEVDVLMDNDYPSTYDADNRHPLPTVKWEIFRTWYPWATDIDLREYELYLQDKSLPNPLISRDFLARKAAWEAK